MAPEIRNGDIYNGKQTDIFSFGVMLYEIASGEDLPGHGARWDFLRSGQVPRLAAAMGVGAVGGGATVPSRH